MFTVAAKTEATAAKHPKATVRTPSESINIRQMGNIASGVKVTHLQIVVTTLLPGSINASKNIYQRPSA